MDETLNLLTDELKQQQKQNNVNVKANEFVRVPAPVPQPNIPAHLASLSVLEAAHASDLKTA